MKFYFKTIAASVAVLVLFSGCSLPFKITKDSDTEKTKTESTSSSSKSIFSDDDEDTKSSSKSSSSSKKKSAAKVGSVTKSKTAASSNTEDYNASVDKFINKFFTTYADYMEGTTDEDTLTKLYSSDSNITASIAIESLLGTYEGTVNKYTFKIEGMDMKGDQLDSLFVSVTANVTCTNPDTNKRVTGDFLFIMQLVPSGSSYQVKDMQYETKEQIEERKKQQESKANQYDKNTKTIDTTTDYTPSNATTKQLDALSIQQIVEKNDPKTVAVLIATKEGGSIGSGFFVTRGVFITNFHVIKDGQGGVIRTFDGKIHEIEGVLFADADLDIAMLKLKKEYGEPVTLGDVNQLTKGEQAVAIGSPKGLFNTVSTGIISNKWNDGNVSKIQISIPITHGNSGGPLINSRGEVVGINSSGLEGSGDLNFAISVEHIIDIVNEAASIPFNQLDATPLNEVFEVSAYRDIKGFGSEFGTWDD